MASTSLDPNNPSPPPLVIPALLNLDHIITFFLPLTPRTVKRYIREGIFPKCDFQTGDKIKLWKRETVENWVASQSRPKEVR